MFKEEKNEKRNDTLVYLILTVSFLLLIGRFLIDNSNILRIKELNEQGRKVNAAITSLGKPYDNGLVILQVSFAVDKQQYEKKITLPDNLILSQKDKITLHYLPKNPKKAVYLTTMKESFTKYAGGWTCILVAVIYFLSSFGKLVSHHKD